MARQIGTVLGVAGLVAILSHVNASDPVLTFKHAVLLVVALFAAAGVVSALFIAGRKRPVATLTEIAYGGGYLPRCRDRRA